jgi:hypothetical protein
MSGRSEEGDLTALERALRELLPKTAALHRDVLMYRAGRASARSWIWPAATFCSATAALVLGIVLWIRPEPPVVYVAVPAAPAEETSPSPPSPLAEQTERGAWSRYVHVQEQVSLYGLDGLPAPSGGTGEPPADAESLLNSL